MQKRTENLLPVDETCMKAPPQMLAFQLSSQCALEGVLSRSDVRINHQVLLSFSLPLTLTFHCLRQVCYSSRLRFSFCRHYEGILKRPNKRTGRDTCCIRQAEQATETWSLLLEEHKLLVLVRLNKYCQ